MDAADLYNKPAQSDPRVAMLQIAVESLVESFKEQFEEYVRKIVVKVLDARDEALLEKLNKISEKHSQEDAKVLEERYNSLVTDTKSNTDGWVKWEPAYMKYDVFPDISPDTKVEVEFRNGIKSSIVDASYFVWSNEDFEYDIVAYRIVK